MAQQNSEIMIQAFELASILRHISDVMSEHKDELCQLDAQMGDGDLGITMSRGWLAAAETAVAEAGSAMASGEPDLGKLLVKSGMKMAAVAPSTMGTLMSSGLIEAGKRLAGHRALDGQGIATFLEGFCQGMIRRGRCSPGDRTVLDSVWPAARAAEQLTNQVSLADAAVLIRDAAKAGLESTRAMEPKFGRAAVLAARTKGLVDQGAWAGFLMVDAICSWLLGNRSTGS
jgi:dihydroxyacetone kinase-like protein